MNVCLGWRADCQERFDRGETVAILCKSGDFLYRVLARRRGIAKTAVK